MKILITGGAGFIGSHLADALISDGNDITVADDLSGSDGSNIPKKAKLTRTDVCSPDFWKQMTDIEAVFHFAADPDVKESGKTPDHGFKSNVLGTFNVMEACRKNDVKRIVFASTSTVYGENAPLPTPETWPCAPISNYGASKLAGEAYCQSYSSTYGIKTTILRYANVYGERATRGVMRDFYFKLRKNPGELEILGDGKQEKSYIHVTDAVAGTVTAWKKQKNACEIFNVGGTERNSVLEVAGLIAKSMKLKPKLVFTGGRRGWAGDIPAMHLSVKKLETLGWEQKTGIESGVERLVAWLSDQE